MLPKSFGMGCGNASAGSGVGSARKRESLKVMLGMSPTMCSLKNQEIG